MSEEEKKAIEELKEFIKDNEVQNISIFTAKKVLKLIENKDKELETYKKIAEILAQKLVDLEWRIDICDYVSVEICESYGSDISNCKQCIIDWARNEVEKDDN